MSFWTPQQAAPNAQINLLFQQQQQQHVQPSAPQTGESLWSQLAFQLIVDMIANSARANSGAAAPQAVPAPVAPRLSIMSPQPSSARDMLEQAARDMDRGRGTDKQAPTSSSRKRAAERSPERARDMYKRPRDPRPRTFAASFDVRVHFSSSQVHVTIGRAFGAEDETAFRDFCCARDCLRVFVPHTGRDAYAYAEVKFASRQEALDFEARCQGDQEILRGARMCVTWAPIADIWRRTQPVRRP